MITRHSISRVFTVLLVVLIMAGTASARTPNASLGTAFTYQGKLTDGGAPATGLYDFEFKLYDALSGGGQVGGTVTKGDVAVANGLFTVQLDFGNVFDGTALFLQIGVRPGASVGTYAALDPRQPLTATPYAVFASSSPWSGLTGVPVGFADGVDNGSAYQNVKVVAKSGGDFATITAALNSITDNSAGNHYLVYVAPGVYSETVTMKQFVDIQGAGELATKITAVGNDVTTIGTVTGASNAELRFLTVENTGGAAFAVAIGNSGASPRLTHVTASASGGGNAYGVLNDVASPWMTNVIASASGSSQLSVGVGNSSSWATMMNVTASASGLGVNYGVINSYSSPTMTNVIARATAGVPGVQNAGVYNDFSSVTINDSVISGSDYGISNNSSGGITYTVKVNNSQISGGVNTILNNLYVTTRVGASQLSGGPVEAGGGTITCAGVYDENYAFYASTCP